MRVTNSMLVSNMMRNLNNNMKRLDKYQNQQATGKKIRYASDDPVIASRALKLRTDLSELEQYEKNTNDALSWLEITESAVANVGDVLQRARELTVKAANGVTTTEDKQKISAEMEQLKQQLISSGNTTYAGRYIFSGYNTDEELFNKDGSYNMDITSATLAKKPSTSYEIGIGDDIQVSTNGIDIFGYNEINTELEKLPYGHDKGKVATQAEIVGTAPFDFNYDFTAGTNDDARIEITVDGTMYTVSSADLTAIDGSDPTASKKDMLKAIMNADDGSGNKLTDKVDIYFNIEDKLVIKSKSYGDASTGIQVDFIGDTGGGLTDANIAGTFGVADNTSVNGTKPSEATISGIENLQNTDIASDTFQNTEFLISINGESKRISIGALAPPTVTNFATELQNEINSQFSSGQVVVTAVDSDTDGTYGIEIKTVTSTPYDGAVPELRFDTVRSKESTLIQDFEDVIVAMNSGDEEKINEFLGKIDNQMDKILSVRADIGARVNRMELVKERILDDTLTFTKLLSQNEGADMAEVIMKLQNEENVYRAALAVGSKVIQPTLIDFLR